MDQDKLLGLAVGLLGGWLLFGAWEAIALGLKEGQLLAEIFQPIFLMKLLASIAAFVAGVTVLAETRGSAWLTGIASCLMGVATVSMIATGLDKSLWQHEIMYLFVLTALFLGMLVAREQNSAQNALEAELAEIAKDRAAGK